MRDDPAGRCRDWYRIAPGAAVIQIVAPILERKVATDPDRGLDEVDLLTELLRAAAGEHAKAETGVDRLVDQVRRDQRAVNRIVDVQLQLVRVARLTTAGQHFRVDGCIAKHRSVEVAAEVASKDLGTADHALIERSRRRRVADVEVDRAATSALKARQQAGRHQRVRTEAVAGAVVGGVDTRREDDRWPVKVPVAIRFMRNTAFIEREALRFARLPDR